MANQKGLVVKGVLWTGIQMLVNQSFSFIIRLVLAKLLFPEQFGIVGMAAVFTGFVQVLNDLGIAAALVQRKDQNLRSGHFYTAFWTGTVWAVVLYAILSLLVAPLAATFYGEPILHVLIPVLSLGILSGPINLVHKAILTRNMDFKKMALIDNTSNIAAGVISLILAFLGAGVWSLAFNSVASIVIAMPLYFKATSFTPRFTWDKDAFKDIFGFGVFTTGTNVTNYLINNIDYLLIGKLLSAQALGAYSFAFILTDIFRSRLMAVINNVMYPVYGKNQDDFKTLKNYYLKVVNYNSVLVFPIMGFMILFGHPFILSFFGEKWIESIGPLKILALAVMIHMMVNSNTALIRGMGRPKLELILQLLKAVIFIPILAFGIVNYGVLGAAYAVLANKFIAVVIAQITFNRLLNIKIGISEFLLSVKEPWIAVICSGSVAYTITIYLTVHYLYIALLFFVIYFSIIWMLMGRELKGILVDFKKNRKNDH